MKFSLSDDSQYFSIAAYSHGQFTVRGRVLNGSQLIWPEKEPAAWDVKEISDLSTESISSLIGEQVETVLLGTGEKLVFPDDEVLSQIFQRGIGVEIMDTPAACRTFNILVSEGRNVVAALIPV